MDCRFTLCLPRDEASVPVVRHVCRDALRMLGVADECVGQIELAVTEACTNVLRHVEGTDAEYEVSVAVNERICEIRLVDAAGQIFDHETQGRDEANLDAESGRGIFLMRAMVDELDFVSEPEIGSVVRLVKKLELKPDAILRKLVNGPPALT